LAAEARDRKIGPHKQTQASQPYHKVGDASPTL
jgi:hypothetical protein